MESRLRSRRLLGHADLVCKDVLHERSHPRPALDCENAVIWAEVRQRCLLHDVDDGPLLNRWIHSSMFSPMRASLLSICPERDHLIRSV